MKQKKRKAATLRFDSQLPYNYPIRPRSYTSLSFSGPLYQVRQLPIISDQKAVTSPIKVCKRYLKDITLLKADINSVEQKYLDNNLLINEIEALQDITIDEKLSKLNEISTNLDYQPESEIKEQIKANEQRIEKLEFLLNKLLDEEKTLKAEHQQLLNSSNMYANNSRDEQYLQQKLQNLHHIKAQKKFKIEKMREHQKQEISAMHNKKNEVDHGTHEPIIEEETSKPTKIVEKRVRFIIDISDKNTDESLNKEENSKNIEINRKESFNTVKMAADKGDCDALVQCALMLFTGDGIEKNIEEAINYLKMSAELGNLEGIGHYVLLSSMLDENKELQDEFSDEIRNLEERIKNKETDSIWLLIMEDDRIKINDEIIKYLKISAEKGDIKSYTVLGCIYDVGKGVPVDKEKRDKYWKLAADNDELTAMDAYGWALYNEDDEDRIKEGLKYMKMAADKGYPSSAYYYAQTFTSGRGNPIDIDKALHYFKIASDLDILEATKMCGNILFTHYKRIKESLHYYKKAADENDDVASFFNCAYILINYAENEIDKKEGVKYMKKAIEKGDITAMNVYSSMLFKGEILPMNKEEAVKYLKMGVEKGDATAMNNYANILQNGDGVQMNQEEAIKYYKMSADLGNEDAMYSYGFALQNGIVVSMNKEEAIKYFKMAIEKGDVNSMVRYGMMLDTGEGMPVDHAEANKYYKMAIEKGSAIAMNNYAFNLENGGGVQMDKKEAIKLYIMAIEKGCPASMFHYGKMLQYGNGIEMNKEEAMKYYQMAMERGEKRPQEELEKLMNEHK